MVHFALLAQPSLYLQYTDTPSMLHEITLCRRSAARARLQNHSCFLLFWLNLEKPDFLLRVIEETMFFILVF